MCPINPGLSATLTIEVVATAAGSFDGTFTPVSAQTGPCILVDNSTIEFGDVPIGSTVVGGAHRRAYHDAVVVLAE